MEKKNNITPFGHDVSKWYSDLITQSELFMYGPVKGTIFLQPYGFKIWDLIKTTLNKEFEKRNVLEVYFPLLMPESLLQKEAKHIEGFAPEVLTITHVGKKQLSENYVIRPTSEMLMNTFFQEKLTSYKQLPYKINQWVNVMRWENNTRPFLRTSEFLWQEGHTNHSTELEAHEFSKEMLEVYNSFANDVLRIPVFKGEKTSSEKFAGAENSYTIEAVLRDGQCLQSGTSHYLGQTFTKALNVKVLGSNNLMFNPFQTSWGVSTRLIGAIIMTHSDDKGLVLPSGIAPFQVVIVTIGYDTSIEVQAATKNLYESLKNNFRVSIDDSDKGIGFKSQEWEVKGVPVRIEIGPRDIKENKVSLARRDVETKQILNLDEITVDTINNELNQFDENIYKKAKQLVANHEIKNIDSLLSLQKLIDEKKYLITYWKEDSNIEAEIKEKYGLTIRCLFKTETSGKCLHSKTEVRTKALIARAY